jgi:hypothetical protein
MIDKINKQDILTPPDAQTLSEKHFPTKVKDGLTCGFTCPRSRRGLGAETHSAPHVHFGHAGIGQAMPPRRQVR